MLEDKAKEKENREGRTMGAAREQSDGAFKAIRESQSSFVGWGGGPFPGYPRAHGLWGDRAAREEMAQCGACK